MDQTSPVANAIYETLDKALKPSRLEVRNDSDKHQGHAGHDGSGESHFTVTITASQFAGMTRPARHRMVYELLDNFLKTCVHALSIKAIAPEDEAHF